MKISKSKFCLIAIIALLGKNVFGQTNSSATVLQTNAPQIKIEIPSTFAITNALSVKPDEESLKLLREATSSHTSKDVLLLIVGAFLAGFVGFITSFVLHKLEVKQRNKEEQEFKENVLRAIRCELESLSMIYEKGIGSKLKESENLDFFPVRLSLTQEWFTVFNANAVHLGKIEKGVSNRIITTYALNKALIEAFTINNDYLAEMARVGFEIQQRGMQTDLKMRFETVQGWLVVQKAEIKKADEALKATVKNLFEVLDEQGVS